MSKRKIVLNQIINNHIDTSKMNKYDKQAINNAFIMFAEQLLDLAAENANIISISKESKFDGGNYWVYEIDKKTIIDTIKQVEF